MKRIASFLVQVVTYAALAFAFYFVAFRSQF